MRDAKVFSKLDFASGFWQLELDQRSRKLTTFITPVGRFIYKRLPFGITSAPEIFQKTVSSLINTLMLDNVLVHADDILITGKDMIEHDRDLFKVLKLLSENGLTLNFNKCEFRKSETSYLGYVISRKALKLTPSASKQ